MSGRSKAVELIKRIAQTYSLCEETRDTAIMIFDEYKSRATSASSTALVAENDCFRMCSVVCLIIASKMQSKLSIRMSLFSQSFRCKEMAEYECMILSVLELKVQMQTPTYLTRLLVRDWDKSALHPQLDKSAELLIGRFWDLDSSREYSALAISISAMLLALAQENSDGSDSQYELLCFLQSFLLSQHNIHLASIDVSNCLNAFIDLPFIPDVRRSFTARPSASPVGADDMAVLDEVVVAGTLASANKQSDDNPPAKRFCRDRN